MIKKKAEVIILGQKYSLKGNAPEARIREIASYVDSKIREVLENAPDISQTNAAILAAVNVAEEYYKIKDEQEKVSKNIEAKSKRLSEAIK